MGGRSVRRPRLAESSASRLRGPLIPWPPNRLRQQEDRRGRASSPNQGPFCRNCPCQARTCPPVGSKPAAPSAFGPHAFAPLRSHFTQEPSQDQGGEERRFRNSEERAPDPERRRRPSDAPGEVAGLPGLLLSVPSPLPFEKVPSGLGSDSLPAKHPLFA